jgi:capsular exopolysaccharide synthesis family protein
MEFIPGYSENVKNLKSGTEAMFETFLNYASHYKLILVIILVFVASAYFYLKDTVNIYEVRSTIMIKDFEQGSSVMDLSEFENMGLFSSSGRELENELQILNSRKLMSQVVSDLQLYKQYFEDSGDVIKELYIKSPIDLSIPDDSNSISLINSKFELIIRDDNSFEFIDYFDNFQTGSFGDQFSANLGNENADFICPIKISKNENFTSELFGKKLIVKISPSSVVVNDLMNRIVIEPVNQATSDVIQIKLRDEVKRKSAAVISNLIEQYNLDGIRDNNLIAESTVSFLDSRIDLIANELSVIEGTAEQFMSSRRMVDSKVGSNYFMESSSSNERDLVEANTQMQLVSFMLDELNKVDSNTLLPGHIGLSDVGTVNQIKEYNSLVLRRRRISNSSSDKNPIIIGIDDQLADLKNNLTATLENLKSSILIQIEALNNQSGVINSKIASMPKNEREYLNIVRDKEIKNSIYLYLLQKREESVIANAVSFEKAKIIDPPFSDDTIVFPKRKLTYLASVFGGLALAVLIIFLKYELDVKIHKTQDLERFQLPIIGDIPMDQISVNQNKAGIKMSNQSELAEAYRYLRTNIGFMLSKKEFGNVVFVTSTLAGEGKTFTAINLAQSFAASGKRTLLIGLDLRAPKIDRYLNLDNRKGVSNYVVDKNLFLEDIIDAFPDIENLDFILSGDVPPNPIELLMNDRTDEIFSMARKNYDYIIVDTPPIGMVADALQISNQSDLLIYVVKANFLNKNLLKIPLTLASEGKLKNLAFLLNGTEEKARRYGYSYGYAQKAKPSLWNKFFG